MPPLARPLPNPRDLVPVVVVLRVAGGRPRVVGRDRKPSPVVVLPPLLALHPLVRVPPNKNLP